MEEIQRNVDHVLYETRFEGDEAATIAARSTRARDSMSGRIGATG